MDGKARDKVRRRRFLASSPQGPLLKKVYWLILVSLAVQATLVYLVTNRQLEAEYYRAHQTIASTLEGLVPWIIGASLIALLAALFGTLRFTLSLAGPTYRLRKHLRSVADGDLTEQIMLRRGDELHDLAREINRLVDRMEKQIARLQQTTGRLRDLSARFAEGKTLTGEEIESLNDAVARLEETLAAFRTSGESTE